MSSLDNIIQVSISRSAATPEGATFNVPGIIGEFATDRTTTPFTRARSYASLTEMTDDGWASGDAVYDAAIKIFGQSPAVSSLVVGRRDSGDADWAAALTAIQAENPDWYTFGVVGIKNAVVTFDSDFVASNSIVVTINDVDVTAVPFNTDQATTMGDLETQIESDITGSVVTVTDTRELTIEIPGSDVFVSAIVTGGVSQPSLSSNYHENDSEVLEIAAWTETQKKIYLFSSDEPSILTTATDDIFSQVKALSYGRTGYMYTGTESEYKEFAWMGKLLGQYEPGEATWAFKNLAGVTADNLNETQQTNVNGKNGSYYVSKGGVSITFEGNVASGSWIDVTWGLDWVEAEFQTRIFTALINTGKIPYDDSGILILGGYVNEVLNDAVDQGIFVAGSITLTLPKFSEISAVDKGSRIFPDIKFTATEQGAIHTVQIDGNVSF